MTVRIKMMQSGGILIFSLLLFLMVSGCQEREPDPAPKERKYIEIASSTVFTSFWSTEVLNALIEDSNSDINSTYYDFESGATEKGDPSDVRYLMSCGSQCFPMVQAQEGAVLSSFENQIQPTWQICVDEIDKIPSNQKTQMSLNLLNSYTCLKTKEGNYGWIRYDDFYGNITAGKLKISYLIWKDDGSPREATPTPHYAISAKIHLLNFLMEIPMPVKVRTWEKDDMAQVFVPAGKFVMGRNDDYDTEKPAHVVNLDAYWIDKYEVTNAQYARCVAEGQCLEPASQSSDQHPLYYTAPEFKDYPVIEVSWNDAAAYCRWAGRRLPTEAEWEKAARGLDKRKFSWGNENPDCSMANFYLGNNLSCVNDTAQVGSYPSGASPYGVMDMGGNVWEWVNDWFKKDYYWISTSNNPSGPETGDDKIIRGGSWAVRAGFLWTTIRSRLGPDVHDKTVGFRCASSSDE